MPVLSCVVYSMDGSKDKEEISDAASTRTGSDGHPTRGSRV